MIMPSGRGFSGGVGGSPPQVLSRAFRDELSAAGMVGTDTEPMNQESRLAALVARGRAAHPTLAVDEIAFVRHLARCAIREATPSPAALALLAIEDLYLACACLLGVAGAAAAFDASCAGRIRAAVASPIQSEELRDDVEQRTREILLVGSAGELPKIGNYSGRAALDRWVGVVALRAAITAIRGNEVEQRARDRAAGEVASAAAQPELEYARQRYRGDIESALAEGLTALDARERLLLRMHVVRGMAVESIGQMFGVSQSTASRWLAQARETLLAEVQRRLRARAGISASELPSLIGLVASQIDVSISRLLETPSIQKSETGHEQ